MLTREEDIDVHALRKRGWTISAIARHLRRDRKTIRAYLAGREPGVRQETRVDPFDKFEAYCAQRLADDPHVWASTLFDEVLELLMDLNATDEQLDSPMLFCSGRQIGRAHV